MINLIDLITYNIVIKDEILAAGSSNHADSEVLAADNDSWYTVDPFPYVYGVVT